MDIEEKDSLLITKALDGSQQALELLIKKHQSWIYNVSLMMVAHPDDAADITQEVLIKLITNLATFNHKSNFRTWLYRIIKNHFLNMKRTKYEQAQLSFTNYFKRVDTMPDEVLTDHSYAADNRLLIEETKIACMKGMLLCLNRDQRFIFIIGAIFNFSDDIGSQVMEISKGNFRVKLHRAKKDLFNFMNNNCGLIHKKNPCRCAKKTVASIKAGHIDPKKLLFQQSVISSIEKIASDKSTIFVREIIDNYQQLYQNHPFLKGPDFIKDIRNFLASSSLKYQYKLQ